MLQIVAERLQIIVGCKILLLAAHVVIVSTTRPIQLLDGSFTLGRADLSAKFWSQQATNIVVPSISRTDRHARA